MNVCILVHSELVSESLWSFARLRAGVSPCRAFTCIHVHLHYIHVSRCIHVHSTCIRVHSCASACISCVHSCAFMCIHVHPRACAFYVHSRALHVHFCASTCIYTKNLTCRRVHLMCTCARISVHSRALSRHPCVFLCIRVHLSASQLCAFMRITVHQQCIYCHSHDLPSCPIMSNLAGACHEM